MLTRYLGFNKGKGLLLGTPQSIVKKSAVIAVTGNLSEVGRKVYNALLAFAQNSMSETIIHQVSLDDFIREVGFKKCRNYSYLKDTLTNIQTTLITHDNLGVDGTGLWLQSCLISSFSIKDGILSWEYPSSVRGLLATGKLTVGQGVKALEIVIPYAIIDRSQEFKSKYSGILYELCLHWLPNKKNKAASPWFSLEETKALFGGEKKPLDYNEYYDLNRFVITVATKEINKRQTIPFTVALKTRKLGRGIAFIKFEIVRKKKVKTSNLIDVENPREFIKALLTINGLHSKTIAGFIDTAAKFNALAGLAEKTQEICERYAKKSPVKEKIKAITGGLNKHFESLAQLELPFDKLEKATPREINKQAVRDCIQSKPFCEVRLNKQPRTEICRDCLILYPLD